jgi:uncharacterized protein
MLIKKIEGRLKLKYLLIISLVFNLTLSAGLAIQSYNNFSLRYEIDSIIENNEKLSRTINILNQRSELLENQLEYYKQQAEYYSKALKSNSASEGFVGQSNIDIVAVKQVSGSYFETQYEGVVMRLHVELEMGEGRLLINTQPQIGIDLQTSAKTALIATENFTGISLEKTDVILTVKAEEEVQIVDGPSAGAAITIALIAAIFHHPINPTIYITGTIDPNGTIGQVGGIPEKSLAASQYGAEIFLVPETQSSVTIYEFEEQTPFPGFKVITSKPKQVSLEDYLKDKGFDLEIIEIDNISSAYKFFTE